MPLHPYLTLEVLLSGRGKISILTMCMKESRISKNKRTFTTYCNTSNFLDFQMK